MTRSDHDLLADVARQDRDAFSALYDRFAGRAYGVILHVLQNRTDADDVFQETFLQIWNQAGRFDPSRSTPEGWSIMIARSRAVDRLRKKRLTTVDITEANPAAPELAEEVAMREQAGFACRALNGLDRDQRDVIRLAYFHGLTHTEIARKLNLPLGTVKTRIRQGMMRLRDELSDAPETP